MITALSRYAVGSCTVNPTVLTLPTTAGAVATFTGVPLYATETTDQNAMGGLLYDSTSCATACAASTTQPTVPGNPVTPVVTPILVTG